MARSPSFGPRDFRIPVCDIVPCDWSSLFCSRLVDLSRNLGRRAYCLLRILVRSFGADQSANFLRRSGFGHRRIDLARARDPDPCIGESRRAPAFALHIYDLLCERRTSRQP
jgi:hypothetical protein